MSGRCSGNPNTLDPNRAGRAGAWVRRPETKVRPQSTRAKTNSGRGPQWNDARVRRFWCGARDVEHRHPASCVIRRALWCVDSGAVRAMPNIGILRDSKGAGVRRFWGGARDAEHRHPA